MCGLCYEAGSGCEWCEEFVFEPSLTIWTVRNGKKLIRGRQVSVGESQNSGWCVFWLIWCCRTCHLGCRGERVIKGVFCIFYSIAVLFCISQATVCTFHHGLCIAVLVNMWCYVCCLHCTANKTYECMSQVELGSVISVWHFCAAFRKYTVCQYIMLVWCIILCFLQPKASSVFAALNDEYWVAYYYWWDDVWMYDCCTLSSLLRRWRNSFELELYDCLMLVV